MFHFRMAVFVAMFSGMVGCSRSNLVTSDAQALEVAGPDQGGSPADMASLPERNDANFSQVDTETPGVAIDAPASPDSPVVSPDAPSPDAAMGGDADTMPRISTRKFVGNTLNGEVRADFVTYWNQLSMGPSGRFSAVRTGPLQYDWRRLDAMYAYTRRQGIPFHAYSFIEGLEEPRYFATDEEARAGVEDWIRSFCVRYPDSELINVVLEPLHRRPFYAAALGGAGASGYDWIVRTYQWARTYCPRSLLLLTDYNTIENKTENDAFIKLLGVLRAAGAPIDALGVEGTEAALLPTKTVKTYLEKLAALGLPLYITNYGIAEQDDAKQLAIMQEQFPLFWNDDRIRGITFWGYVVGDTWRNGLGLITSDGIPRPAMTWLMSYLGR